MLPDVVVGWGHLVEGAVMVVRIAWTVTFVCAVLMFAAFLAAAWHSDSRWALTAFVLFCVAAVGSIVAMNFEYEEMRKR